MPREFNTQDLVNEVAALSERGIVPAFKRSVQQLNPQLGEFMQTMFDHRNPEHLDTVLSINKEFSPLKSLVSTLNSLPGKNVSAEQGQKPASITIDEPKNESEKNQSNEMNADVSPGGMKP
ncbi:hypothetical protein [Idiomarina abyssalis]|uniref:Uncharacterized protein n=1 Tax=Idiomarina abyssalis TaxID=86102 RepID=A0A8I1GDC7_9GAMM|nr:hypothetical protein [Idiomarina abyssalis]MBJ7265459.1 hypothetical protein [Idiomarina abyssalis]MBJ7316867.1 hypothetical protein [Idiomarina abyssalis]